MFHIISLTNGSKTMFELLIFSKVSSYENYSIVLLSQRD
jgi:hypothetical protein